MTLRRAAAAVMAVVVAAAGFPVPAAAQVVRVGESIVGPGLGAFSAPAPLTLASMPAPSAMPIPALSPSAAASIVLPAAVAAAPVAAVPPAAVSFAGPVLSAASIPSDAPAAPASARAAVAPRDFTESGVPSRSTLFDGAPAAASDGPYRPSTREPDLAPVPASARPSMRSMTRRRLGALVAAPGVAARLGRFAARVTGVSALWGLYRDGVLVQRNAERLTDSALPAVRRATAARMLASLGRVDAVPLLGRAAESDESPRVRRSARAALVFLADTAGPGLVRTLKRSPFSVSRETAAVGLGWIARFADAPAALEALGASGLNDPSEDVRLSAIAALAGARSPKAIGILSWMRGVEKRPAASAAVERAFESATARLAVTGRMNFVPPAEDLPLAANPIHAAALRSSIAVGLTFAAIEFAGGLMTGTLALRADALHLAGDRALDAAALLAMFISRRPPTSRKTYGWLKAEAVFSFVGALAIAAMGAAMIPGVYAAFVHPVAAHGWSVLGFASLSVVSNLISAYMLYRHSGTHLGVRGAFLHAATDAVGTLGVMAAAAASLLFGWTFLMPLSTAALVVMVLRVAWELGRPSWDVLMDSVPSGLDMDRLESDLRAVRGVASVVDLHVRTLNSMGAELSAKVYAEPGADHAAILAGANAFLRERYGIVHSTIQIETAPARPATGR